MDPQQEIAYIQDVPLEIGVELDRRFLKIRDILELQVGSIIEMTRSAGENIDIYVGKKLVAFGEIVIIENSVSIRITDFRIDS
ncbi:MAG: FliM/FliN family flagellar motor switch protein [Acidobacteriota bacterium]|nr:FliM/FliN family flagellar motor switch protein [Acidobacteriota bacterium]